MSAHKFCIDYISMLEMIDACITPEYYPAIRKLYVTDPRDLITPETWFATTDQMIGFLWRQLITIHKQLTEETKPCY